MLNYGIMWHRNWEMGVPPFFLQPLPRNCKKKMICSNLQIWGWWHHLAERTHRRETSSLHLSYPNRVMNEWTWLNPSSWSAGFAAYPAFAQWKMLRPSGQRAKQSSGTWRDSAVVPAKRSLSSRLLVVGSFAFTFPCRCALPVCVRLQSLLSMWLCISVAPPPLSLQLSCFPPTLWCRPYEGKKRTHRT